MNRSELIERIAAGNNSLNSRDTRLATLSLLHYIADALVRGDRIEVRNFGVLDSQQITSRQVRNPRTGEKVWAGPRRRARFRMAKNLRLRVNS